MKLWIDGVERDATPEEEAAILAQQEIDSAPRPEPVPTSITPAQLFLGLAGDGYITDEEALDAAQTGAVPAAIDALFSTLEPPDALVARVRWARMTVCLRADPLVAALGAANQLSPQDIDDAFRRWALL